MSKRIGIASDIHLNFATAYDLREFMVSTIEESLDVLLIGGDIGDSQSTPFYLEMFDRFLDCQIYFVLGNHDFYESSFAKVKEEVRKVCNNSKKLFFLDDESYLELNLNTAIIGESGIPDGREGNFEGYFEKINDYFLVEDFKGSDKNQILNKLNEIGDNRAQIAREKLEETLNYYKNVIFLTHVPPFKEATLYKGKIKDDNFLPHFTCKTLGDKLKRIMDKHPNSHLKVYCGHSHEKASVQILNNLEVVCMDASYGYPKLNNIVIL
jgi:Icc-related predicted phosphoesterase